MSALYRLGLLAACVSLLVAGPARAQQPISLDQNDMPNVGDTLRLSLSAALASGPALSQAGPNQTWNYAGLRPTSQRVESYTTVAAAPFLLSLAFGQLGGVNQATIASRQALPAFLTQAGFPISDVYSFFRESAADYRQVGFGVVLSGVALPVTYQNQQAQDVVYRFPLTYTQQDSSFSDFVVNVPGVGYLRHRQRRVNRADGWGTLSTPFGTFAVLRVVSTLTTRDSVSLPGQAPFVVPAVTREYKWLGKGQGIPLLQVTTQVVAGRDVVTAVQYRDVYRRISGPLSVQGGSGNSPALAYPNPLPAATPLRLQVPTGSGPLSVVATDLAGRQLFRGELRAAATGETVVPAAWFGQFRGVALLRVSSGAGVVVQRIVRE